MPNRKKYFVFIITYYFKGKQNRMKAHSVGSANPVHPKNKQSYPALLPRTYIHHKHKC